MYSRKTSTSHRKAHTISHEKTVDSQKPFYLYPEQERNSMVRKLICGRALPYRICEDKMFRHITGTKMNRNTISSGMKRDFKELRNKLRLKLNETNYIAVTADFW